MNTNGEIIADALSRAYAGELLSSVTISLMDGWLRDHIRRGDIEVRMWPGSWLPHLIGSTPEACTWLELPSMIAVAPVPPVWPQAHRSGGS